MLYPQVDGERRDSSIKENIAIKAPAQRSLVLAAEGKIVKSVRRLHYPADSSEESRK